MIRRDALAAAIVFGLGLASAGSAAQAEWPERAVTIVVPAGAGGGTDGVARLLTKQLQEIFKKPFNVVNNGEGGGAVGHSMIANAEPDGYTLGLIFPFAQMKLMGQADLAADSFTPIAQVNFDPAGFNVRSDAPYPSLKEALDDIKANPGKYTISCGGGCGGSWHLPMAGLFLDWGIDVNAVTMIPSKGAAAGLQELVAGGVDFIPCSLPEAGPLVQAGKVRPLVVMSEERIAAFPDVPTVKEITGEVYEGGAWRGVAGPAGLPEDIVAKMGEALEQIFGSEEFQSAMTKRGFGLKWRDREQFAAFLEAEDESVKRIMTALGLVKG
ncbi:tripartite tricarboxylate transporter substrate binding protein [Geminicoccaceae bacterium 1502E]|nr:tripartite tricarboxylate transporter substrate binding protein [Geminicoccaceae bacterium 1502E]